jgi:UDP-N-acetylglucosamine acyltransferase
LNQVGLQRAGISDAEQGQVLRSLKKAFKLLYRSGLALEQALEQIDLLSNDQPLQHLCQFMQLSQTEGRRGLTPGQRSHQEP